MIYFVYVWDLLSDFPLKVYNERRANHTTGKLFDLHVIQFSMEMNKRFYCQVYLRIHTTVMGVVLKSPRF